MDNTDIQLIDMFLNSYPKDSKTRINYKVDINQFAKYAKSINKGLLQITIDDCNNYFNNTSKMQLYAGSSFNRKIISITKFYERMKNRNLYNDILPTNEVAYKDSTPENSGEVKFIINSDIKKIIKYAEEKYKSYNGKKMIMHLRNYIILFLMFNTGFRRHEIVTFEVRDVDFINNQITNRKINSKNGKSITRDLSENTIEVLKNYIKLAKLHEKNYLFESVNNKKLHENEINRILSEIINELNMTHITPHMIRHTFAKVYYMKTKDIVGLQEVLNHKKLTSTERYVSNNLMSKSNKILDLV